MFASRSQSYLEKCATQVQHILQMVGQQLNKLDKVMPSSENNTVLLLWTTIKLVKYLLRDEMRYESSCYTLCR